MLMHLDLLKYFEILLLMLMFNTVDVDSILQESSLNTPLSKVKYYSKP